MRMRLGYSKQTCQGEVVIKWHPGNHVYRLTFGIRCGECAPARMGPSASAGHTLIYGGVVLRGEFMGGNGAGSRHIYYLMQVISLHKGPSVWETTCLAGPEHFKSPGLL